jgi:hypothetical protein
VGYDTPRHHGPEDAMSRREQIADVLHDFYIEASTRRITREEFEAFIDRIIALFEDRDKGEAWNGPSAGE